MPNNRHQRNHRQREDDTHNNNQQAPVVPAANPREVVAVGQAANAIAHQPRQNDNAGTRMQKCCTPGCCRFPDETIDLEDPFDSVKVLCNNESCVEGRWMHKDCFEEFEQSVLSYLRSCGRARSWSEKQRLQNLWTKKGYDLAFKACDCKCGRGHLRKDLDYIPPPFNANARKQKKHKKKNDKPMPVVSTTHKSNSHSSHVNGNHHPITLANQTTGNRGQQNTAKKSTVRSTTDIAPKTKKTSKPESRINDNDQQQDHQQGILDNHGIVSISSFGNPHPLAINSNLYNGNPNPQLRLRTNSVSSTGSVGSHCSSGSSVPSSAGSPSPVSSSPVTDDAFLKVRKSSDASSDSGSTVLLGFRQRLNLSAFSALSRVKQNPYHIRIEDPSSLACSFSSSCSVAPRVQTLPEAAADYGGCDVETRNFVLSNLLNRKVCSMQCALCKTALPVFDRFPLLDGTFFLSPQSYDEAAIQVIRDGRLQFLNAVCLSCLEGHGNIKCVACRRPWDGRYLVVGSMYTYDIFAAAPCCQKRLTCKSCRRAVIDVAKGLDFYSQYSQMVVCPYCKTNDYHFIRSLSETFSVANDGAGLDEPICH